MFDVDLVEDALSPGLLEAGDELQVGKYRLSFFGR